MIDNYQKKYSISQDYALVSLYDRGLGIHKDCCCIGTHCGYESSSSKNVGAILAA